MVPSKGRTTLGKQQRRQPFLSIALLSRCLIMLMFGIVFANFYFIIAPSSSEMKAAVNKQKGNQPASKFESAPRVSEEEGRLLITSIFQDAGVKLSDEDFERLPTWNEIQENIGPPVVFGLDRCSAFRDKIPALTRNIGCCGMFNSGTNLVTRLLKENVSV